MTNCFDYWPNPLLIRFTEPYTGPWSVLRAAAALILDTERDGSWHEHAVGGTIRVVKYPQPVRLELALMQQDDCSEEFCARNVELELQRIEHYVQRQRNILREYGGKLFCAPRDPVGNTGEPAWDILESVFTDKTNKIVWVNGVEFRRDPATGNDFRAVTAQNEKGREKILAL